MNYQINPVYDAKLVELGIKEAFIKNLEAQTDPGVKAQAILDGSERLAADAKPMSPWSVFIQSAFIWQDTPEGRMYWEDIAQK